MRIAESRPGRRLSDRLRPHVVAPEAIRIVRAETGRDIARIPLGGQAERRYGAPYWVIHRADLQGVLAAVEIDDLRAMHALSSILIPALDSPPVLVRVRERASARCQRFDVASRSYAAGRQLGGTRRSVQVLRGERRYADHAEFRWPRRHGARRRRIPVLSRRMRFHAEALVPC